MSDREEWTPWIEHDGKGCPCVGMWVHRVYDTVFFDPSVGKRIGSKEALVRHGGRSWTWDEGFVRVIRYRIRKPRALQQLREMIETLPAPRQKEDAHV